MTSRASKKRRVDEIDNASEFSIPKGATLDSRDSWSGWSEIESEPVKISASLRID